MSEFMWRPDGKYKKLYYYRPRGFDKKTGKRLPDEYVFTWVKEDHPGWRPKLTLDQQGDIPDDDDPDNDDRFLNMMRDAPKEKFDTGHLSVLSPQKDWDEWNEYRRKNLKKAAKAQVDAKERERYNAETLDKIEDDAEWAWVNRASKYPQTPKERDEIMARKNKLVNKAWTSFKKAGEDPDLPNAPQPDVYYSDRGKATKRAVQRRSPSGVKGGMAEDFREEYAGNRCPRCKDFNMVVVGDKEACENCGYHNIPHAGTPKKMKPIIRKAWIEFKKEEKRNEFDFIPDKAMLEMSKEPNPEPSPDEYDEPCLEQDCDGSWHIYVSPEERAAREKHAKLYPKTPTTNPDKAMAELSEDPNFNTPPSSADMDGMASEGGYGEHRPADQINEDDDRQVDIESIIDYMVGSEFEESQHIGSIEQFPILRDDEYALDEINERLKSSGLEVVVQYDQVMINVNKMNKSNEQSEAKPSIERRECPSCGAEYQVGFDTVCWNCGTILKAMGKPKEIKLKEAGADYKPKDDYYKQSPNKHEGTHKNRNQEYDDIESQKARKPWKQWHDEQEAKKKGDKKDDEDDDKPEEKDVKKAWAEYKKSEITLDTSHLAEDAKELNEIKDITQDMIAEDKAEVEHQKKEVKKFLPLVAAAAAMGGEAMEGVTKLGENVANSAENAGRAQNNEEPVEASRIGSGLAGDATDAYKSHAVKEAKLEAEAAKKKQGNTPEIPDNEPNAPLPKQEAPASTGDHSQDYMKNFMGKAWLKYKSRGKR